MALTSTEEALVRQLIAQNPALLSLAGNEATITSKLSATKVSLADLDAATVINDADLLLIRQGTQEKSVTGAVVKDLIPEVADASETVKGIVELATAEETAAGTDNTRAVHPAGLASILETLKTTLRQTVLSGPVDANGFAAFGGVTGSTTVTASGTLKTTASFGINNRVGTAINPSWTGLSTNGTMFLYLDIAEDGTCTTGSTSLIPIYQWGGAYSIVNGQSTFNIQEMTMKVGNGSTANQVWRVFVGEVIVSGGVVTNIVWYALMGRYDSGWTNTLPSQASYTSKNHKIGVTPDFMAFVIECISADAGYSPGDRISNEMFATGATYTEVLQCDGTRLTIGISSGSAGGTGFRAKNKVTTLPANLVLANWKWKFIANRGGW